MRVRVQLRDESTDDDVLDLRNALAREPVLRGNVHRIEKPTDNQSLGALTEALSVTLVPGAISAFAYVVGVWIKNRSFKVSIKIVGPDGQEFSIDADRLRRNEAQEIEKLAKSIAAATFSSEK